MITFCNAFLALDRQALKIASWGGDRRGGVARDCARAKLTHIAATSAHKNAQLWPVLRLD